MPPASPSVALSGSACLVLVIPLSVDSSYVLCSSVTLSAYAWHCPGRMDFGVRHTQILLLPIGLDQVKECLQAYYLQKQE